ncbi:MAG: SGNH/GDSL hydrolase family protein [Proteobacteria bacterium]|nr:SGNH/GDSL hydrolase family protein [Pseudomonadota bacterium]
MPVSACLAALFLGLAAPASAGDAAECSVDGGPFSIAFPLEHVKKAIADKSLSILVVGAGSSQLPGQNGAAESYPARLQQALTRRLPGVQVSVATDVKSRRTAADMVKTLPAQLAATRPALMLWQTATVDAMQAVDPDQFSQALDSGIRKARAAGADVMFINPQYSPRTESMIALGIYVENMRWVAVQQEVPVFDRFSLMKAWSDQGTFDFYSATRKLDMAMRVHDCIGRMLADLVLEAAKAAPAPADHK